MDCGHTQRLSLHVSRADIVRQPRHVRKVPIRDLPNAAAALCKVDYRKSAIAISAGHAVERAARHSNVCQPMGVPATHHMGAGSGKSMQHAELIQLDRHLKKTAPFFANCAYLKLACAARKRYSASLAGSTINLRWME